MSSESKADLEGSIKPKRVLSEAQRLAFLKGRETRMANLEKKRLEKEEALFQTKSDETQNEFPEKPKLKRAKVVKVKKEVVVEEQPLLQETVQKEDVVPPSDTEVEADQGSNITSIDEDKIASRVAAQVIAKINESTTKPKPRNPTTEKKKTKKEEPSMSNVVRPKTFAWI
jgi:hypothetical protein